MSLTLNLPTDLENRLRLEAERRGVEPESFALSLLEKHLVSQTVSPSNSLARLFAEWDAEDATTDPQELARRQKEWEELRASLNANHGPFREPIR
jgi:hypothetical protein